ncbi:MAG: hypothetical protein UR60_C0047G0013 [Candidatus Moranbacteria bacterium GW2011_GWF2_34_56]|nr:MAG: hypothetical protein UR51_C0009G0004 [Candidatus Moranbacteria bacterium GW2011_GWF1_34_10]KKP63273.1 MAG: hypothetical protein UR60_C0047G0013 [Candidatus Moranbacteria bacterium GW2011_GWF2_34_56]
MLKSNSCVIVLVFVASLFFGITLVNAEDKSSGYVIMQTDAVTPVSGKTFLTQDVNLYFTDGGKLGTGIDTTFNENGYRKMKPFATWRTDNNLTLIGGFSADSSDAHHVFGGFNYFRLFGKSNSIFVSPNFYFSLEEKSSNFFDFFAEVKHDLGNDFALALEVVYDYWPESETSWGLVGPVFHYKLTKNLDVYTRVSGETDLNEWTAFGLRAGLSWSF